FHRLLAVVAWTHLQQADVSTNRLCDVLSMDRILEFISFQMSLLRALSSGIILAVLDTNLKADQDEQIQRIILGMGFQEEHILDLYDK
ncbi:hypothetical protein, partial [Haloferax volcanii]|uniref:hypothetical protein n=1 Tax=Haloferax volcanii TaxID=2246 RepID=UPI0019D3A645